VQKLDALIPFGRKEYPKPALLNNKKLTLPVGGQLYPATYGSGSWYF